MLCVMWDAKSEERILHSNNSYRTTGTESAKNKWSDYTKLKGKIRNGYDYCLIILTNITGKYRIMWWYEASLQITVQHEITLSEKKNEQVQKHPHQRVFRMIILWCNWIKSHLCEKTAFLPFYIRNIWCNTFKNGIK